MDFSAGRRTVLRLGTAGLIGTTGWTVAEERTIKLLVGFPPGGTTDLIARMIGANLSTRLGRTVVVENRAGASGNIAAGVAARAAPDGTTLLMASSSHATSPSLYTKLPYDPGDLSTIAMVAATPYVLVVHPSVPVRTTAELVQHLKAQPGSLQYATASPGTGQHLAAELFKRMAGVEMTQVPYRGSAAAMPDLIAGRTPVMFENLAIVQPHIRSQALRPLAVTSSRRTALIPELPTVAETLPGFEILGWFALLAPSKVPEQLVTELNAAVAAAVAEPATQRRLTDLGAEAMSRSPNESEAFVRGEIERWGGVIRAAKITID